jgi:EAL domain-containing protein (putative c-di-GMP-specific phosphodiesterase class I)
VETEHQLRLLQQQGCDEIQGFIYGNALSPDDFKRAMQMHDPTRWQSKID